MHFFKNNRQLLITLNKLRQLGYRYISDVQKKIKNSYYFMHGDVLLSSSTVGHLVDNAADNCGDHISFISAHQNISKTFSEFRQEANKLASGLISLGLEKGDRIAICSPNCYEWPLVQCAAAKAGLVLVNINPAYRASELKYSLTKTGCKAVVTWDVLKTQDFYEILCEIIPELPKSSLGKVQSKNVPSLETVIMITKEPKDGILTIKDVMNAEDSESDRALGVVESLVQMDDPVSIQFTSGTTGLPKAAMLSHHNVVNNALTVGRRAGFNLLKPIACCQVPVFHAFGNVLGIISPLTFQSTCVYPFAGFSAEASLEAIEKYKCTTALGAPTMFMDILNSPKLKTFNIDSLKQVALGGAATPETVVRKIRDVLQLSHVNVGYGQTENSCGIALNGINDDFENAVKGILQPLEYVELKVIDTNGRLVPINTEGEICTRGHLVFMGYWDSKEKTAEAIDQTRWFRTGDLGIMNEYGFIKVVGRRKEIVIRGGENINPAEIENFLHTHPAVREAYVVGVPDTRMGEELCAWILVQDGVKITEDEIKNFCNGKISHFKIPRYILFVKDFPKTHSGKAKKFEMQKISIEKLNL